MAGKYRLKHAMTATLTTLTGETAFEQLRMAGSAIRELEEETIFEKKSEETVKTRETNSVTIRITILVTAAIIYVLLKMEWFVQEEMILIMMCALRIAETEEI